MLVHFAYLCDDCKVPGHMFALLNKIKMKRKEKGTRMFFLSIFLLSFLKACFSAFHSPLNYCAGLFSCKNCGQFSSLLT